MENLGLNRIGSLITEMSSLEEALIEIMRAMAGEMGVTEASVFLVSPGKESLECKCVEGGSPEQKQSIVPRIYGLKKNNCIETNVVLDGNAVLVTGFQSDQEVADIDVAVTQTMGSDSTFYVPLKVHTDVIGVIKIEKNGSEFTRHECETACTYASYVTVAVKYFEMHEALMNERSFSENVFNSSVNGMLTVDKIGRITSLNDAAEKILEVKRKYAIGAFIKEAMRTLPESGLDQMMDYIFSGLKETKSYTFKFKNKAGKNVMLDVKASPIFDDQNAIAGFLFAMEDIAEEYERIKYLQNLNRLIALGELAAGIAHGIRNPLTGIEIVMDVLRNDEGLSEANKELTREISIEIDRIERLVSDLLEFARPKRFTFDMTQINDVIESTRRLIHEKCQMQHITFLVSYENDLPLLFLDFEMIRQAILNIAINCIRAMPDGGELRIETARGVMENEKKHHIPCVSILIRDTGNGIPEPVRDRIFDPFFTTHKEGTGLGLSITYSIVKEHNGRIDVGSDVGEGTTFTISLPVDMWEGFS
ncbi:MAG: ATP-binding protein [Syntrophales bacterium]|jgi:two-component system sensor histidine kinase AtoS|nr:ATP-binding protein [Syntrophales bacterium]MDX9923088.1 ATP-binding protein [Syntrophales bacterium]